MSNFRGGIFRVETITKKKLWVFYQVDFIFLLLVLDAATSGPLGMLYGVCRYGWVFWLLGDFSRKKCGGKKKGSECIAKEIYVEKKKHMTWDLNFFSGGCHDFFSIRVEHQLGTLKSHGPTCFT